jgi:hypothetical protein
MRLKIRPPHSVDRVPSEYICVHLWLKTAPFVNFVCFCAKKSRVSRSFPCLCLPSVKSVQSVAWNLCSLRVLLYSALTSGLVFEIYAFL